MTEDNIDSVFNELMSDESLIVEPLIEQHPDLAKFGGGCVNSVRIVTIVDQGECNVIFAVFRIGSNPVVDNFHAGGVVVAVDLEKGEICSSGMTLAGEATDIDPSTGAPLIGFKIPYWQEALELVKNAAMKTPKVRYIGWDVAITEDGPIFIEGNPACQLSLIEYTNPGARRGHRELIQRFLDEV